MLTLHGVRQICSLLCLQTHKHNFIVLFLCLLVALICRSSCVSLLLLLSDLPMVWRVCLPSYDVPTCPCHWTRLWMLFSRDATTEDANDQ